MGFSGSSDGKETACSPGDLGLIPGSGRFPGVGNGNLFQCSCLENFIDRRGWQATVYGVAKSWTHLSTHTHTHTHIHIHIHSGILLSYKKKKEWYFTIFSYWDRLEWHFVKWNKSDRERQILYDVIYMNNIKQNKLLLLFF